MKTLQNIPSKDILAKYTTEDGCNHPPLAIRNHFPDWRIHDNCSANNCKIQ